MALSGGLRLLSGCRCCWLDVVLLQTPPSDRFKKNPCREKLGCCAEASNRIHSGSGGLLRPIALLLSAGLGGMPQLLAAACYETATSGDVFRDQHGDREAALIELYCVSLWSQRRCLYKMSSTKKSQDASKVEDAVGFDDELLEIEAMDVSGGKDAHPIATVPPRLQRGLALLLEASSYAAELAHDVWDFAVELHCLKDQGLTKSDVSWMVCKGFVEHKREVTGRDEDSRCFEPEGKLKFSKRSCFVLTPSGLTIARRVVQHFEVGHLPMSLFSAADEPEAQSSTPKWDEDRHELRVGPHVVKAFKGPSPNQQTILTAFEEDGWPQRIDDPLPLAAELEPKRRLQDTIKSLNRNQKHRLIRFTGDGTGEGICWQLTPEESSSE